MEDTVEADTMIEKLCQFVSDEDWKGMKKYLSEWKEKSKEKSKEKCKDKFDDQYMMILLRPTSVHKDNILHLAVHSKKKEPLQQLLELVQSDMYLSLVTSVNAYGNTILHEAAICRNLEAVELLAVKTKELIRMKNDAGETPLFRAAAFGNTNIVKFLATSGDQWVLSQEHEWKLQDYHRKKNSGASIVGAAIRGKHFGTAFVLLKMDPKLADVEDKYGSILSYMISNSSSVFNSRYQVPIWKKFLYLLIPLGWGYNDEADNIQTKDDDMNVVLFTEANSCLQSSPSAGIVHDHEVPSWSPETILRQRRKLASLLDGSSSGSYGIDSTENEAEKDTEDSYWIYLSICSDFIISVLYWIYLSIWSLIIAGLPGMRKVWKDKRKYEFASKVAEILVQSDKLLNSRNMPLMFEVEMTKKVEGKEEVEEEEERKIPLFSAIKEGNVKLVKDILKKYPRAFGLVNYRKQNILHVAAMYRQKEIFNFVTKNKIQTLRLARQIDVNGYTILHSVADTEHYKGGSDHSDPVYQLQKELAWFNSVEEYLPPYYSMHYARTKRMTAWKLFKSMHEEQHKAAKKWTGDTSRLCYIIAVLVASIVFAATFTVPSSTIDNNSGLSIFCDKPVFLLFTVPDIVSISCSLAAALIFLNILSWPLKIKSFDSQVPRFLTFGFFLLSVSVGTAMLAYTWTTFNIIRLADYQRGRMNLPFFIAFFLVSSVAFLNISFIQMWKNIFKFILPSDLVLRFFKFACSQSVYVYLLIIIIIIYPLFYCIFMCLSCWF